MRGEEREEKERRKAGKEARERRIEREGKKRRDLPRTVQLLWRLKKAMSSSTSNRTLSPHRVRHKKKTMMSSASSVSSTPATLHILQQGIVLNESALLGNSTTESSLTTVKTTIVIYPTGKCITNALRNYLNL